MFYYLLLLFLSIIPAVFLLWYFERQDKGRKEPLHLKWKIFRWGVFVTIVAAVIELNIEDIYYSLNITPSSHFWIYIALSSFVTAAFVEEALKLWVVKTHVYKDKHFDEIMDGVTYTIIASLGFATLENILYVFDGGIGLAITRALISVPAHAMFSGIMGYYIGKARFSMAQGTDGKIMLKGFLLAVFYHGLFNFLLFTESWPVGLVFPLLLIMWAHLRHLIKKAHFEDKTVNEKPMKFGFVRILRIFFGSIFILWGVLSAIGSILVALNPLDYHYSKLQITFGLLLAVTLFAIGMLLIRRKTKRIQSSP